MTATSDSTALLEAIKLNPEDDTPRLIYADCIQEEGNEPYAEFIRVQCELAQLEANWDSSKRIEEKKRHDELVSRNNKLRWDQDVISAAFPMYFTVAFATRGFVEVVDSSIQRVLQWREWDYLYQDGIRMELPEPTEYGRHLVEKCPLLRSINTGSCSFNYDVQYEQFDGMNYPVNLLFSEPGFEFRLTPCPYNGFVFRGQRYQRGDLINLIGYLLPLFVANFMDGYTTCRDLLFPTGERGYQMFYSDPMKANEAYNEAIVKALKAACKTCK
jgi:uncharacterized protein (TIGR02996 family)